MLSQYAPDIKATIAFLKLLNVRVCNSTVSETLQSHPAWPSFLSVSDALNKWNVPNAAGKITRDRLDELPVPFLAYIKDTNAPLAIVKYIDDERVWLCAGQYKKFTIQSREDFLNTWDGIYLIAEPTAQSGEKGYRSNKRKALAKSSIKIFLAILLTTLSGILIYTNIHKNAFQLPLRNASLYIEYFILTAGLIITVLLLWSEIDNSNPFLQKVCSAIVKGNCHAVLTSKASRVFSWLSWSEVGLFYFSGALLTLIFSSSDLISNMAMLMWLNVAALSYVVFSVYYQWRVIRQWCVLCLAIQALLVLGATNGIASNLLFYPVSLTPLTILKNICLYGLPILAWFVLKPYLLALQEAKQTRHEYLRIKFNMEIFETLLKKQKRVTISPAGLGISLGNPTAPNTLIKVCNPYCGPCGKAHPKVEKLLEANSNLKVQIIFNTPGTKDEPAYKPVSHLLAMDECEQHNINIALDDWYQTDKKDYSSFARRYPMNGELSMQEEKIRNMAKWCKEIGIQYTPTFFFNGYQVPEAYNIEDLAYFLLE